MLKQIFLKKLGKLSTQNVPETNNPHPTEVTAPEEHESHPIDRTFSFADAEKLAELLTEESVKSRPTFFRQHPHRPNTKKSQPDGHLQAGIEAPVNTPASSFLGQVSSTSTTSISESYNEDGTRTSKLSLVETFSTTADEGASSPPVSFSSRLKELDFETSAMGSTVREEIKTTTTITSNSGKSPSTGIQQAKRWGRTVVRDFTAPIRKYQIRQGKQPLARPKVDPIKPASSSTAKRPEVKLSKKELEIRLTAQSTSQSLENFNLQGGHGPPKPLSMRTFAKLDHFDHEITRISKELAQVKKEKEVFIRRIESDDFVDEDENVVQKSKGKKKKKTRKRGGKDEVHFEKGLSDENSTKKAKKFFVRK